MLETCTRSWARRPSEDRSERGFAADPGRGACLHSTAGARQWRGNSNTRTKISHSATLTLTVNARPRTWTRSMPSSVLATQMRWWSCVCCCRAKMLALLSEREART